MKIYVPSMLAIGVEMINKQTQQTHKQPQWHVHDDQLSTLSSTVKGVGLK